MLMVIHIVFALASIGLSGWALARPAHRKIRASYGLIGGTLLSGAGLVIAGGSLLSFCISGTVFTVATLALCHLAEHRLAVQAA